MYNSTGNPLQDQDGTDLPRIPVVIVLSLLSFGTVLGNSVVFAAICTHPGLRRVTYMAIFSLAVADFLVGMIAMPSYIMKKFSWDESIARAVCDAFRFSYFVTGYASILSLCVISVERLIAIKNSLRYTTIVTRRRVILALLFIWLDAVVMSSLPFVPWPSNTPHMECNHNPTNWWSIMVIVTNVIVPFSLIAACYTYMYLTARTHIKKISSDRNGRKTNHLQQCKDSTERRANITIMIVIGVFVVTWFPSCFYYFLQKTCPACFPLSFTSRQSLVNALVKILTFTSSFANPIIYCWRSREFRSIFLKLFLQKKRSIAESFSANIFRSRRNTSTFKSTPPSLSVLFYNMVDAKETPV